MNNIKNNEEITLENKIESILKDLKYTNKLLSENERLKKEIENVKDINTRCSNEYNYFKKRMMKLEKENKQLKSTNMEMEDYLGRLEERIQDLEKQDINNIKKEG